MTSALRDRYGFLFWLAWIVLFAAALAAAAAAWTAAFAALFGTLRGEELKTAWAVSVFGSWFLLVVPFMRKKERIWKRLNPDEEKAADAWFYWMAFFLALLAFSAIGWCRVYAPRIYEPGFYPPWSKAVLASWLGIAVPFLILMYRKADAIFRRAEARQRPERPHRVVAMELSARLLPDEVSKTLGSRPATIRGGHLVTLVLKDGRRVGNVFVHGAREIRGVYDRPSLGFAAAEIAQAIPMEAGDITGFEESRWVRFESAPGPGNS